MTSHQSGRGPRRSRGGSRRRSGGDRNRSREVAAKAPPKKSFVIWLKGLFGGNGNHVAKASRGPARNGARTERPDRPERPERIARKPESVEVTSSRLYVGNLSFTATESDLFELFNGVGQVQNAEVVTYKHNQRSKGFAFVQMLNIDEAKRAVSELHDKEFLGRKLVVSGAKSTEHSNRD